MNGHSCRTLRRQPDFHRGVPRLPAQGLPANPRWVRHSSVGGESLPRLTGIAVALKISIALLIQSLDPLLSTPTEGGSSNDDETQINARPIFSLFKPNYTLRCLKLRFSRVKKWSVSFASGRRSSHRFPTVAIRRSLLQTFGAQLRKINRCGV